MIDIRDALYIPGLGFSTTMTKDQSLGSPEADFAAVLEKVRAAREKQAAEEGNKAPFIRGSLTKEDIKELAARYDPTNMTQEEYDSFLDDLIEKGVLEKNDLKYIDYRGDAVPFGEFVCVGKWDLLEDGPLRGSTGGALTWTGACGSASPVLSYRPSDANVLAWAKEMSLWMPASGTANWLEVENRRNDIFTVLVDALGAMQCKRESRI